VKHRISIKKKAKEGCNMQQGYLPTIPMGLRPVEEIPDSTFIKKGKSNIKNAEIPLAKICS
jgi:hypothetical protein